jgi:hypothetical protein
VTEGASGKKADGSNGDADPSSDEGVRPVRMLVKRSSN